MTAQPENKDKAAQKISKDELSEKELEKATGGVTVSKSTDSSSTNLFKQT
jgi:hypothetical protein